MNYEDGFLDGTRYLIRNWDTKFCDSFWAFLSKEDVEPLYLPPRSPNRQAQLERVFGSLKSGCLDRRIMFGEKAM